MTVFAELRALEAEQEDLARRMAELDPASLEGKRLSTLKDAFDFVPGVFVQPRMGGMEARTGGRGGGRMEAATNAGCV